MRDLDERMSDRGTNADSKLMPRLLGGSQFGNSEINPISDDIGALEIVQSSAINGAKATQYGNSEYLPSSPIAYTVAINPKKAISASLQKGMMNTAYLVGVPRCEEE